MYSILIADDELRLCKLITNLIHWDEKRLRLIGYAHDGISCMEQIRTEKPDIVISDIRMPGISGLDVVSKCREEGLETCFIMLTGYSEFDYAYNAIKKGVIDFLLKPVNADELNQAIDKALMSLGKATTALTDTDSQDQQISAEYIIDFFYGHHTSHNPSRLVTFLSENQLLPCIMSIDKKPDILSGIDDITSQLLKLIRSRFQTENASVNAAIAANRVLILFQMQESGFSRITYYLHSLLDAVLETSSIHQICDITICIGTPIAVPEDVLTSLFYASSAYNARILLGNNRIIDGGKIAFSDEKYVFPQIDVSELMHAFNSLDVDGSCNALSHLFTEHLPTNEIYAHRIFIYSEKFLRFIDAQLNRHGDAGLTLSLDVDTICNEIPKCSTLQSISQLMVTSLRQKMVELRERVFKADHQVIRLVKLYIDEHYGEALTLASLGQHVYLNPVYLGNLFKKATGQNFSAYLTSVRMDKAKEFLVNTVYTINEIAELTGYHDTRHFSKTFTKHVGIRPNEYRKYHAKLN